MFDECTLWYLPSPLVPNDLIPNSEEEVSEAELPLHNEEIRALRESLISFRLSGPNEELSRDDQPFEDPTSSGDSVMLFPRKESRSPFTRKEKGTKKMSECDFSSVESNCSKFDFEPIEKEC